MRGQQRHTQHSARFVDLAEESKSVLLDLGVILNQRYRGRGPSHQTQRSLQRKNEAVSRLEQFITDQQRVCETQERAEQSNTVQEATIERLEKQLEQQRLELEQERLRTAFDEERAQLLEQASDAAKTQQDISRKNCTERETALTCPISLDLFENPVLTTCCGRTFSSEALTQALRRNPQCPVCRAHRLARIRTETHAVSELKLVLVFLIASRPQLHLMLRQVTRCPVLGQTPGGDVVEGGTHVNVVTRGQALHLPQLLPLNQLIIRSQVPTRDPLRQLRSSSNSAPNQSSSPRYGRAPRDSELNFYAYAHQGYLGSDSDY
ncbi:uncharacterized protein PITG_06420 [Phytophthora infestans T30-4]|uniref:RING-type domain-containing protein n=1 Tax=Phytophthora infestans (strain T30-4) TaxID=403677 RepID=D0N4U1_PHYIT|nr:uncharacterized protein PITG_06420 [Phytophthora infestans T30-4]EEY69899.1 conserved hypothetical protein [Phytophthora infestans T30-4]|eukprot:XP_002998546.1 conserved hypothetical protein [Phytophthora infestans T30-4]